MEGIAEFFCDYDTAIIIIFAVINAAVWGVEKYWLVRAGRILTTKNDLVNGVMGKTGITNADVAKLKFTRKWLVMIYTFYANITAVFPLLGILGTVAALISYTGETIMDNFMIALGTTLFGVAFAIIFKCADAFISGPLDLCIEDYDTVIREYEEKNRGGMVRLAGTKTEIAENTGKTAISPENKAVHAGHISGKEEKV